MQVFLSGKFRRRSTILVAMTLVALLTFRILRNYLAERAGQKPALSSLQRAARLDASNSDYQLRLGRFYEYDPANTDPDRAMAHLERAVELNPYDPQTWLELGAAHEFQGQSGQAEAACAALTSLPPTCRRCSGRSPTFSFCMGTWTKLFDTSKWCWAAAPGTIRLYSTRPGKPRATAARFSKSSFP